eukprot:CAMPEP_0175968388 /NCGR_PEP_ID=MMETSP0108-20121206/39855_1 /TAXON_ID=195067 ORGANISM="Goniomonas pacifica, Strain CCMP1869" /NCGR_SAMPLE_ID=MMETSP0108 /ASSEMBLY_ACC=CAM_ASM_000204 /LENGTH=94 /DNA_ID=CAMNT_0017297007 /DNA_START=202 /DNA_END=490 /DNA_ORIENTATION=+
MAISLGLKVPLVANSVAGQMGWNNVPKLATPFAFCVRWLEELSLKLEAALILKEADARAEELRKVMEHERGVQRQALERALEQKRLLRMARGVL